MQLWASANSIINDNMKEFRRFQGTCFAHLYTSLQLQFCLECMIQEFVHKKTLALTAVYLITEETTEFQVLEDQN